MFNLLKTVNVFFILLVSTAAIGADTNSTEIVYHYQSNDIKTWVAQHHFDKESLVIFDWGGTLVASSPFNYLDIYNAKEIVKNLLDEGIKVIILTSTLELGNCPPLWLQLVTIVGEENLIKMSTQFDNTRLAYPNGAIALRVKEWCTNTAITFLQRGGVFFNLPLPPSDEGNKMECPKQEYCPLATVTGIIQLLNKTTLVRDVYFFDNQPNNFSPFESADKKLDSNQKAYLYAISETKLHLIEASIKEKHEDLMNKIMDNQFDDESGEKPNDKLEKEFDDESEEAFTAKRPRLDRL